MTGSRPICKGCQKFPDQLVEYQEMAEVFNVTPEVYVEQHEETFDPRTRTYFCTDCWARAGMPVNTSEGVRLLATRPTMKG